MDEEALGENPLQWGKPPRFGVCDMEAACSWNWLKAEASGGRSRTLVHPSFQPLFTAVSGCSRPSGPSPPGGLMSSMAPETGPLLLMDSSSCFYTDPTLPPGYRIYNGLSHSTQEVLRRLQLNAPAPIMAVSEASSPPPLPRTPSRCLWLSEKELSAALALLELSAAETWTQAACDGWGLWGAAARPEDGPDPWGSGPVASSLG